MASIHPLTDASALGHLLVVVLVDRLERRPLEQDRSLACVPGQCREIVDADVDGGVSSIVLFLFDLGNLIDEFYANLSAMRDDTRLLEYSIRLTDKDGLYREPLEGPGKTDDSVLELAVLVRQDQREIAVLRLVLRQFRTSLVLLGMGLPVLDGREERFQFLSKMRSVCCAVCAVGISR